LFQDVLAVKSWMDLLKGLQSYANFQRHLAAKLCIVPHPQKKFGGE